MLNALKAALDRGVDVRIIYDARRPNPRDKNVAAVSAAGLNAVSVGRRTHAYISHNKVIVRLVNGAGRRS